jgi:choline dehydrogenase
MKHEFLAENRTYDLVVVGAGAAGCVLANRLSERRDTRVLLVEAGGSDRHPNVTIPAAFAKLFRTKRDWAFSTAPQAALGDRRLFWPRGKMLGGSSSMNAQMWVRGQRADYEAWARAAGAGWSFAEVAAVFERLEARVGGSGGQYGREGLQWVEDQRDPNESSAAFLDACGELGIPRLADLNDWLADGGCALSPVTQRKGTRWSSADAFLRPALSRPNLELLTGAHVRRVLFEGDRAVGIEVDAGGTTHRIRAQREVIVAAGAVGSPHLLLRSGVGPREHLQRHGVKVVADSLEVGENLQDHLMVAMVRACDRKVTLRDAESPLELARYLFRRRGLLTSNVAEAAAFVRSEPSLVAPDVELLFAPAPFIDHGAVKPESHGTTIAVVLLQPKSRGRIRLESADPHAAPVIDAGYLSDAEGDDLRVLARGLGMAAALYESRALGPYAGGFLEPGAPWRTVKEREAFVRQQAETLYHPVGTCRMGDDPGAVVDGTLRVRGVAGLRVADASVMPVITRGHTYAPTLLIAHRAAEWIARDLDAAPAGPDRCRTA